jgi:tetratricopeptide (TPR) repeat protein
MRINTLLAILLVAATACGGSPKTGLAKGSKVPPPPTIGGGGGAGPGTPKPEISKDARKDYQAAVQYFDQNDKGTWNESACRSSADRFQAVVREHPDLVAAQFMVGLSFHRCNLIGDAEKAYQAATRMKGDPTKQAMALSNLGQIYYQAGKVDGAKSYWDSAIKANGKLVAARINVASLDIEQIRKINNPKDSKWKALEEDARQNLSNALGVDSDNVEAYTAYGLLYMEGWKSNKNRLLLAKLLLDEGKKRNAKYPPLMNAYGLYWMHRGALNEALQAFSSAVEGDPKFVEARINAGLLTLGFRKYDTAKEMFSKALDIQPKNYEAVIGLGVALRGLNDLDGAEAQYKKAMQIDSRRGDSYYNLGVLYKDFRANKQNDPDPIKSLQAAQQSYRQARDFFSQFLDKDGDASDKTEAKNNIGDCDKVVKQLDNAITSLRNAPPPTPMPTPTPAPAPAPAPAPKK